MKFLTLEEMKDRLLGAAGTPARNKYERAISRELRKHQNQFFKKPFQKRF